MSTKYDANILQAYADDLYFRAQTIIFDTTLRCGLMTLSLSGLFFGIYFAYMSHEFHDSGSGVILAVLLVTVIAIAVCISEGRRNAFRLKPEAQQLLCQRQIEMNTRKMQLS